MPKTNLELSKKDNDEYKAAIQPVVNEALEAHNLAPAIETALKENKPLNDTLQKIFKDSLLENKSLISILENTTIETIKNNKNAQSVIDEVVSNNDAIKKSKSPTRTFAYWIPIISSLIIGLIGIILSIINLIKK